MAPGDYGADDGDLCWSCGEDRFGDAAWPCGRGVAAAPPSHPALVAVASLGADALARAEAIVAETWRARIAWRVMGAGEIAEHHERTARASGAWQDGYGTRMTAADVFSHEEFRRAGGGLRAWPEPSPWRNTVDTHPGVVAWPALRALAALGLHLVAVDDGRVTLAVEALP